ncbi:MAG: DDE-type integrase/transposase/recombinase [Flavobacteriaceae bacterium]|nr:MAG: DDE-type integrase/transposase/recombinase [Flavobacteriaceae bacterium]
MGLRYDLYTHKTRLDVLTVIIDLFNRKVVGWPFSNNLTAENTIINAWRMAIKNTHITQYLIFHSHRGSQYVSSSFTTIVKFYNGLIRQSMSRKGNC